MLKGQIKNIIELSRKRLSKKLAENKLGDTIYSYSEEEKRELVENATLAQLNWDRLGGE